jgi:plastocyanin
MPIGPDRIDQRPRPDIAVPRPGPPSRGPDGGFARPGAIATTLALALALAGCSLGGIRETPGLGTAEIAVIEYAFVLDDLTMPSPGATVTWRAHGTAQHTVKWADGTPESPRLSNDATYERTFTKPGRYFYWCGIHSSMHGVVTVTP